MSIEDYIEHINRYNKLKCWDMEQIDRNIFVFTKGKNKTCLRIDDFLADYLGIVKTVKRKMYN